jgi:hypothetical protein
MIKGSIRLWLCNSGSGTEQDGESEYSSSFHVQTLLQLDAEPEQRIDSGDFNIGINIKVKPLCFSFAHQRSFDVLNLQPSVFGIQD